MYGLQQTTAPVGEPVSVADCKAWLRQDSDADNDLIGSLIAAARSHVENMTGRQLLTAGFTLTLDAFPASYVGGTLAPGREWQQAATPGGWRGASRIFLEPRTIRIPKPPLQSVSAITYTDLNSVVQTVDPTVYNVDLQTDPGRVTLAAYQIWPTTLIMPSAVQVAFTAGYGTLGTAVPGEYRTAIMMLVSHWYERRGDDAGQGSEPPAVKAMLMAAWNGELEYGYQ